MLVLLSLVPQQVERPYTIPLLAFANLPLPAEQAWQRDDFPFSHTEREKENSRSGNAQVEWVLKGTKFKVICPTTQDPFLSNGTIGIGDERLDEADSADNKLGACRYGCLLSNDPKALAWFKDGAKDAVGELARFWKIEKEFANAKLESGEYRFRFEGIKTGRLGNVETTPWIGRLRVAQTAGWVSASFIEQREEETNGPAQEFWRSSLLSGDAQDAGNGAMLGPFETSTHPLAIVFVR